MQISSELVILLSSIFLLFLPGFHLFLIFLIMSVVEWLQGLGEKILIVFRDIFNVIVYIFKDHLLLISLIFITAFLTNETISVSNLNVNYQLNMEEEN